MSYWDDDQDGEIDGPPIVHVMLPPRVALWLQLEGAFTKLYANETLENVQVDMEILGGEKLWFCHYKAVHPVEDYDKGREDGS